MGALCQVRGPMQEGGYEQLKPVCGNPLQGIFVACITPTHTSSVSTTQRGRKFSKAFTQRPIKAHQSLLCSDIKTTPRNQFPLKEHPLFIPLPFFQIHCHSDLGQKVSNTPVSSKTCLLLILPLGRHRKGKEGPHNHSRI